MQRSKFSPPPPTTAKVTKHTQRKAKGQNKMTETIPEKVQSLNLLYKKFKQVHYLFSKNMNKELNETIKMLYE